MDEDQFESKRDQERREVCAKRHWPERNMSSELFRYNGRQEVNSIINNDTVLLEIGFNVWIGKRHGKQGLKNVFNVKYRIVLKSAYWKYVWSFQIPFVCLKLDYEWQIFMTRWDSGSHILIANIVLYSTHTTETTAQNIVTPLSHPPHNVQFP